MATIRTGYRERDARGRPVGVLTRDLEPAAAGIDGMAAMGRLSALRSTSPLLADVAQGAGAGPIERRTETPAERAARELRDAPTRVIRVTPKAAPAPAAPSRLEEAPMTVTAPAPEPTAELVVPCGACLHLAVCGIKSTMPADPGEAAPITHGFADGIRMYVTAYRIECDHFLGSAAPIVTPTPIRATADEVQGSRQRGAAATSAIYAERRTKAQEAREKADRAAAVMAALARHGGDQRAAAAELGMKTNALVMVAKHAHTRVPSAVAS